MTEQQREKTVLLIEDDIGIAELILEMLDDAGIKAAHSRNGKEARAWLEKGRPQLVLLDYSLPDISGAELVQQIGNMPPFIVTTGSGDERVAVMMMKLGAMDYLVKDAGFLDALPLVIQQALRQIATQQQLVAAHKALKEKDAIYRVVIDTAQDGFWIVDPETLRILEVNDSYCKMVGYSRAELLQMSIPELELSENAVDVDRHLQRVMQENGDHFETTHRHKNGSAVHFDVSVKPIPEIGRIFAFFHNITARKQANEELRQSREKLEILLRELPIGVSVIEKQGTVSYANPALEKILDLSQNNLTQGHYKNRHYIRPDGTDMPFDEFASSRVFRDKKPVHNVEIGVVTERGEIIWVNVSAAPFPTVDQGVVIATTDITERKQAEEQIRSALAEKEVLLRELNHRTKNNLNIVSSLIEIQAGLSNNEEFQSLAETLRNRIQSIALVHKMLYQSKSLKKVDLGEYAMELVSNLVQGFDLLSEKIQIEVHSVPAFVNLSTAIPCGQILNELITNAIKYAFPGDRCGQVFIQIEQTLDGEVTMRVCDNGVGFPPGFDPSESNSLGMILVRTLVGQIHGSLKIESTDGVKCEIRLKENRSQ